MDKKIAGLLGAVAALTSVPAAQAAAPTTPSPSEAMRAASYADLLTPIPEAVALLDADDAARSQRPSTESADGVRVAQYHHHHHHHHHHYRRYHHHHHHHHHYRRYHHHHHHHHHYRRFYHHHHHHHHHYHSQFMAIPSRKA